MSLRLISRHPVAVRAIVAIAFAGAFLLALALSAAPQLHERIHDLSDVTHHECAATLISSGNYDHFSADVLLPAPVTPPVMQLHISRQFSLVLAALDFSLLEHAPPAIS